MTDVRIAHGTRKRVTGRYVDVKAILWRNTDLEEIHYKQFVQTGKNAVESVKALVTYDLTHGFYDSDVEMVEIQRVDYKGVNIAIFKDGTIN